MLYTVYTVQFNDHNIHCMQRVHEKHNDFLKKMNELMDSKVCTFLRTYMCVYVTCTHCNLTIELEERAVSGVLCEQCCLYLGTGVGVLEFC